MVKRTSSVFWASGANTVARSRSITAWALWFRPSMVSNSTGVGLVRSATAAFGMAPLLCNFREDDAKFAKF